RERLRLCDATGLHRQRQVAGHGKGRGQVEAAGVHRQPAHRDNVGNDFGGAVSLAGGAVAINDVNALTLGTLDVGSLNASSHGALDLGTGTVTGNLVADSDGGAITQSGALSIGGTTALDAGAGDITLDDG